MGKQTLTELTDKHATAVVYLLSGGLEHLIEELGGECQGLSIRLAWGDALVILRAEFEERPMVAFVGAATAAGALSRAEKELRSNKLDWKPDKFKNGG